MNARIFRGAIPVALALVTLVSLAGACMKTPVTGRRAFVLLSEDEEMKLGADAYKEALKSEKLCGDNLTLSTVKKIGGQIKNVSGREKWPWEFKVIDEAKTMNAFALPGGKVAVYTGILEPAQNEAALAAIMGHEVAHAVARHGAQRVSQSLLIQAGLSAAALSVEDPKQKEAIVGGLGAGAALGVLLPFSREHELEADAIGLIYMAKAGYDPRQAVRFWERFKKATGGDGAPEFLSTHPAPSSRIRALKKLLPKALKEYNKSPKRGRGAAIGVPASCA